MLCVVVIDDCALVLTVPLYTKLSSCYVSTHVESAAASFKDLVILYRRTLHQDILVEDQLRPPLDMLTVDQEGTAQNK